MSILAINKKANYDYHLLEKYEAGLVLSGAEVKSLKQKHIKLLGAYVTIHHNNGKIEAWLINAHISPYKQAGNLSDYNPTRSRKLLLHKKEISSLIGKMQSEHLTLVPIKVYTKGNLIKLEFGLGRGKNKIDKRQDIKKRDVDKEIRQKLKSFN